MSPLKIDDFSISSTDVAALSEVQPMGSNCDLMVGCVLLHYATLCSGATSTGASISKLKVECGQSTEFPCCMFGPRTFPFGLMVPTEDWKS